MPTGSSHPRTLSHSSAPGTRSTPSYSYPPSLPPSLSLSLSYPSLSSDEQDLACNVQVDAGIRWTATIYLKNGVERQWRKTSFKYSDPPPSLHPPFAPFLHSSNQTVVQWERTRRNTFACASWIISSRTIHRFLLLLHPSIHLLSLCDSHHHHHLFVPA